MTEPVVTWDDILEVGQGGPGCGLLHIDGKQPRGNYRYLPPALVHDGKVYASTFVSGGFIICAVDPVTLVRQELSKRIPYARLKSVEDGRITYFDHHADDSESVLEIVPKQGLLARLAARRGKG